MLNPEVVKELAARLYESRKSRVQLRHLTREFPDMTLRDAYAVQAEWVKLERADGRLIRGYKVGLTSPTMQAAAAATEPTCAPLMDDMWLQSGCEVAAERFIAPKIEAELAFVLGRTLPMAGVTVFQVLAATEYVTPALEVIDARIEQFDRESKAPRKVLDSLADFASGAGFVTGGRPVRPDSTDLRRVGALLYRNAVIEETGLAAAVLDHPARAVAWLANKLGAAGERLNAGDIIMSGAFTRPVPAERGDVFLADYGPLGNVSLRFV